MRAIIEKSELASAISLAGNSVNSGVAARDCHSCARITCKETSFVIETSNGDLWSEIDLTVKTDHPWRAMIPHAQLQGVVSNLDDGLIELTGEEGSLGFSQGGYNARLQTLDAIEFYNAPRAVTGLSHSGEEPSPGRGVSPEPVWTPGRPLSVILKGVASSVSSLADRPMLTGVHLSVWDGQLTAVAANGGRIAIGSYPVGRSDDSARKGALLPPALAAQVAKLADMDEVHLWFGPQCLRAEAPGVAITGLLINAIFPPWRKALPEAFIGSTVRIERMKLVRALKRVNGVANRKAKNPLAVELSFRPGQLRLATQRGGVDAAQELLDVEPIDLLSPGDPYSHDRAFPVELAYLLDAAQVTPSDYVDVQVSAISEEKVPSGGIRNVPVVGLRNVADPEDAVPIIQHWIMARGRNR